MRNGKRIMWGVVFGQTVQTVLFLIMNSLGVNRMFLWAVICGLLLTIAIFTGFCIAWREVAEAQERSIRQRRQVSKEA